MSTSTAKPHIIIAPTWRRRPSKGLFEPFPRHVTTHMTSVSRVRDAGGGGVTAAATPAIACIRHARGSAGRTTDLADSFGAGSWEEFYGARECMKYV